MEELHLLVEEHVRTGNAPRLHISKAVPAGTDRAQARHRALELAQSHVPEHPPGQIVRRRIFAETEDRLLVLIEGGPVDGHFRVIVASLVSDVSSPRRGFGW